MAWVCEGERVLVEDGGRGEAGELDGAEVELGSGFVVGCLGVGVRC